MRTDFQKDFQKSLVDNCQVKESDLILVALSGGADSVALLHLFKTLNYSVIAAHCNFHLRGKESNKDEEFVKKYCSKLDIPLKINHFNTIEYANEKKISIEMAARELRYNWFEELKTEMNLNYIATGHHGDDSIETFFINLIRGTGLKGLTGIAWRKGNIIRPMLFASSLEIKEYCKSNSLSYRTDSTNNETIYYRNKIRHNVIPVFKKMNPSFFVTMQNNMDYLAENELIVEEQLNEIANQIIAREDDLLLVSIKEILEYKFPKNLLLHIFQPFGFSGNQVWQIINSLNSTSGKQFFSNNYRIVKDRFNLILTPKIKLDDEVYKIQSGQREVELPINLKLNIIDKTESFKYSTNPHLVHLDAEKLVYPLNIRHSQEGDKFQPLGMTNFKKLSDFFIDNKFSLVEKENTWVMTSNNDIAWIIGQRIDNRFKITNTTTKILQIELF